MEDKTQRKAYTNFCSDPKSKPRYQQILTERESYRASTIFDLFVWVTTMLCCFESKNNTRIL